MFETIMTLFILIGLPLSLSFNIDDKRVDLTVFISIFLLVGSALIMLGTLPFTFIIMVVVGYLYMLFVR